MTLTSLHDINEHTTADEIREAVAAGADVNGRADVCDDVFAVMAIQRPLHLADNAEQTRALLEAGADANMADANDRTPLHHACDAEQTRLLVQAGADINARDEEGATPLHYAQDAEHARALLAAGADPNTRDRYGRTPLHYAQDAAQTQTLLDAGADPNARTGNGRTPLHEAHDGEQARVLLAAGAEIQDDLGERQQQYVAMASAAIRLAAKAQRSLESEAAPAGGRRRA